MRLRRVATCALGTALAIATPENSARALQSGRSAEPTEHRIPLGNTSLYARVIGEGHPAIVLHGGPDFDSATCSRTSID